MKAESKFQGIAIIGMACRYADARSPCELWENTLAKRQAFRAIPKERLRVEDYKPATAAGDSIYCTTAALLEDYEFDRSRFRISAEAFKSTDMTHWLALDVAAQALEDAHLTTMESAQRERTGAYIGNSLTGEFSRANLMRLRWPFVRRTLETALRETGTSESPNLIERMEHLFKSPFPVTTEESLAGGLSNTISGRISNHFDFKGGAYTVDGACASSLLAIATACSALAAGDVDVALAGGVDLSIDPFELVGFSRLGALARDKMRAYDEHSSGFWPGEGCGIVVLMRSEDALAQNLPVRAMLRGWGVSSDGSGGMTRPEIEGQLLALKRAYERAEYGIETVGYFEGHGTGTIVGDAAELGALMQARIAAGRGAVPAVLSTAKTNIGHTKAAAGIAGLIRAVMALEAQVLPPLTGCERPLGLFSDTRSAVRVLHQAELWPPDIPLRAGVSAMGFGGINVHVAVDVEPATRRAALTKSEESQITAEQGCELFLFEADDAASLSAKLSGLREFCGKLSSAELTDLSVVCARELNSHATGQGRLRAALVAANAAQLYTAASTLDDLLADGRTRDLDFTTGVLLGAPDSPPRLGLLFPGQGSPVYADWGLWARRFPFIRSLHKNAALANTVVTATDVAQPAICAASVAGLQILENVGIQACVAVGHSLGELTAYHWAGAFDSCDLLDLARSRGRAMAELSDANGAMAAIRASCTDVEQLRNGDDLSIAAYNSPRQTVVSGPADLVEKFLGRAQAAGVAGIRIQVSHAFHSRLVAPAREKLRTELKRIAFHPLCNAIVSTVTGGRLAANADLSALLSTQVTSPVRFVEAITAASSGIDLFIEVGPGAILASIGAECVDTPIISLDCGGASLRGLLAAAGAAFVLGAPMNREALFGGRFSRPIDLNWKRRFLCNPCELELSTSPASTGSGPTHATARAGRASTPGSALEVLCKVTARRTELPIDQFKPESRFLADLHLNSISVSQIVLEAAKLLGASPPAAPAEYANATLQNAAEALEQLRHSTPCAASGLDLEGVAAWTRMGSVKWVEAARHRQLAPGTAGVWDVFAEPRDPLHEALMRVLPTWPGGGMVCSVLEAPAERTGKFLLESTQKALSRHPAKLIYLLQENPAAAAFVRSAWLEHPEISIAAVHVPAGDERAPEWVNAEAASLSGFAECSYDKFGARREPRLELLPTMEGSGDPGLSARDIVLVSGGGKGIAAECALALARNARCRLVLLGRSTPELDGVLASNLARFSASGIDFKYRRVDVTSRAEVQRALRDIQGEWGPITAVLHGAGSNSPRRIENLTVQDLYRTLAPKLTGLSNLLFSIDAAHLTTLITFGSVIARTGMSGEADYALANAALSQIVEEWKASHPHCRCLNLEWSVWAGTGMGQRLGVIDSLKQQGISPITLDQGVRMLEIALENRDLPTSTLITSRFGRQPTLRLREAELPFLRFLDECRVYFPGVELITDAELSVSNDPYVRDHALQGEQLFPAVMGLEAMAQVAHALSGSQRLPRFVNVQFERPIVVPEKQPLRIRIAALQQAPGRISVAIRSAETSFQADHFRVECLFDDPSLPHGASIQPSVPGCVVEINPDTDLYGGILFHNGRFRRVRHYHHLHAHKSVAEIHPTPQENWFGHHFPQDLLLGDPAARDAAVHSVQVCIPQAPLVPVSVESIIVDSTWGQQPVEARACEREYGNGVYVYDLEVVDQEGCVRELWEGIRYRTVNCGDRDRPLPLALLVSYLERGFEEALGKDGIQIMIHNELSARLVDAPLYRPDGRPDLPGLGNRWMSISHAGSLTFAITSSAPAGCDLEPVSARRAEEWELLLGAKGWELAEFVVAATGESLDAAATRVWTARESLTKAGAPHEQTLLLDVANQNGWVSFSAGSLMGVCCIVRVLGQERPLSFAAVLEKARA